MKYFVYQSNESDCGFASLKMLLAFLNKDQSYLYLKKTDKNKDYSFFDLINIAKNNNLLIKGFSYKKDNFDFPKTPFLALINENHLVLIKRIDKKYVFLYDPNKGKTRLKKTKFLEIFSYKTLEVVEHIKTKSNNSISFNILPIKNTIIKIVLSIVPSLLLVSGFFFVKNDSYIFIPIILLSLFAISELVEKWYVFKEINFFDKLYIDKYFKNESSNNYEKYTDFLSFKKQYFSFGNSFVISIIVSLLIIVILIINDPAYCVPILVSLLLLILKNFVFDKKIKKTKTHIENLEYKIKTSNQNIVNYVKDSLKDANEFVFKFSTFKCVSTFLIIIMSFLMMIYTNNISVNFIIFNFGVFYVLQENFDNLLTFGSNYDDYQKAKVKFLYQCY